MPLPTPKPSCTDYFLDWLNIGVKRGWVRRCVGGVGEGKILERGKKYKEREINNFGGNECCMAPDFACDFPRLRCWEVVAIHSFVEQFIEKYSAQHSAGGWGFRIRKQSWPDFGKALRLHDGQQSQLVLRQVSSLGLLRESLWDCFEAGCGYLEFSSRLSMSSSLPGKVLSRAPSLTHGQCWLSPAPLPSPTLDPGRQEANTLDFQCSPSHWGPPPWALPISHS